MDFVSKLKVFFTSSLAALSDVLPVVSIWHTLLAKEQGPESLANKDLVTNLPGQPDVSFWKYAGYVTADEHNGRELCYWFYEALTQPDDKPFGLCLDGAKRVVRNYSHGCGD
ncbi:hypothetical protein Nepgr_007260 [Nepenthes gracilis]|uniref:Uncharacterized protein n=1 Tax=Nepenthes gracilis TaxID=150966 RepID=A0AAD3S6V0_NEPGR|nr:hypothetical protein Nepgr_007260 [Nepenthes gracilis]